MAMSRSNIISRMRHHVAAFARARGREMLGIFLMVLAGGLTLAMLSYHAADPSLNNSVGGASRGVQNWLGIYGAIAADLMVQYIGAGAFLAMPALLALGWHKLGWKLAWKLGREKEQSPAPTPTKFMARLMPRLRFMSAILAVLLGSAACALTPIQAGQIAIELGLELGRWASGGMLGVALIHGTGFIYLIPQFTAYALEAQIGLAVLAAISGVALSLFAASWLRITLSGVQKSLFFLISLPFILLSSLLSFPLSSLLSFVRPREVLANLAEKLSMAGNKFRAIVKSISLPKSKNPATQDSTEIGATENPRTEEKPTTQAPQTEAIPVELPNKKPRLGKRAAREDQHDLQLGTKPRADFELPPLRLLSDPPERGGKKVSEDALEANARLLESVLEDFGVRGKILRVRPGPVVTLYELEPAAGIRASRVVGLSDDIARSMSAIACRVATIPGHNVIGIELPNTDRETVYLRELLDSAEFENASGTLPMALGKDIGGAPVLSDLAKMPHLLVAGTTGSGKSVGVNAMILSILYRMTPDQCRMIMVDPKMLELSVYDGIPHLLAPVVTESKKAVVALKWAVQEMENRYRKMSKVGVRNIEGYNDRMREAAAKGETFKRQVQTGFDAETGAPLYEEDEIQPETLPFIVIIIDEMADLMLVAGKEIEGTIQRLAQMARAAGVHLITATQRPSVDVITGTIKANFPSRISFQVTSKIDSRTVLGEQGGEQLLGMGDMLFMAGGGRLQRVHGPFVSDEEVDKIVSFLKTQGTPDYLEAVTAEPEEIDADGGGGSGGGDAGESLYDQAVAIVTRDNRASTSYIQRRLSIGYNRAATLVEQMEEQGVISAPNHAGKREVLAGKH